MSSPEDSSNLYVEIFTDGACSGNPGPGGWGAVLKYQDKELEIFGWNPHTTNNRMEILAAIRALERLKRPCKIKLTTDSQYLKNGITKWLENWKRRGWKTSAGKSVKNKDLWERLEELCQIHEIEWLWTKGHNSHLGNERADTLARDAISRGKTNLIDKDPMG